MNYIEFLKTYNTYEEIARKFVVKYNNSYSVREIDFDTGGMEITCDEHWAYGGYEQHNLTLPLEYFDNPEEYADILIEEKRVIRENEKKKEREQKLKQEKALLNLIEYVSDLIK